LDSSVAAETPAAGYSVLYSFKRGVTDGADPDAELVSLNNELYGTTPSGGKNGSGTVFSVSTSGTERVLHSFSANATPLSGLIVVNGTLYGTTDEGGAVGAGTVFSITTAGAEQTVHSFQESPDGANPYAGLLNVNGELYGTTYDDGGGKNYGCVFALSTSGAEHVVYSFGSVANGPNGAYPAAPLIEVNGELYGTTSGGGASQFGTVFQVSPAGVERVLHSFGGVSNDGQYPAAGLIYVNGTLYGTTPYGGASGHGTVFKLTTTGQETVLYSFRGSPDGAYPLSSLTYVNGTLFGTTSSGGGGGGYCQDGCGTVFKLSTSGQEKIIYTFTGQGGANPAAGLLDVNGVFYGTTAGGGTDGVGTVFKVTP